MGDVSARMEEIAAEMFPCKCVPMLVDGVRKHDGRCPANHQHAAIKVMQAWGEECAQKVRYDCQACEGTGHADAETECEYCGRPMQAIRSLVHDQETG